MCHIWRPPPARVEVAATSAYATPATMRDIRPWNEWACYFVAARQGHLHLLKWLREQEDPPPWIPAVCTVATSEGQLETLQWLRSQGCPWDEKTCSSAASGGHLEVLKWAIANGCPWHVQEANRAAVLKGHHQVVQWLNEHAS
ncbi:Ankyrin repeat-containing domain [Balamuthia mandrillaris]